jgi:hypothetical protein
MIRRPCLTARAAALAAVCAVGVPLAIATASPAPAVQTTATPAESVASPRTTVSSASVRTPPSLRATVRAGAGAAVGATSTARGFLGIATELTTIAALSGPAADPDTPS